MEHYSLLIFAAFILWFAAGFVPVMIVPQFTGFFWAEPLPPLAAMIPAFILLCMFVFAVNLIWTLPTDGSWEVPLILIAFISTPAGESAARWIKRPMFCSWAHRKPSLQDEAIRSIAVFRSNVRAHQWKARGAMLLYLLAVGCYLSVLMLLVPAEPFRLLALVYGGIGLVNMCIGVVLYSRIKKRRHGTAKPWKSATLARALNQVAPKSGLVRIHVSPVSEPRAEMFGLIFPRFTTLQISQGLVELLDTDELAAVLAHEFAHARQPGFMGIQLLGLLVAPLGILLPVIILAAADLDVPLLSYLWIAVFYCILSYSWSLAQCRREFAADAAAADRMGTPQPLIAALQKLRSAQPLALHPRWNLFPTHPPISRRIAALERLWENT